MSGALKAGGRALEEALWSDTNIAFAVTAAGLLLLQGSESVHRMYPMCAQRIESRICRCALALSILYDTGRRWVSGES